MIAPKTPESRGIGKCPTPLESRLLAKTQDDAGCHVWNGALCNGHPAFGMYVDGVRKTLLVRRALWEDRNGKIPAGHIVRCTCGTPRCVTCLELTTFAKLGKQLGALGVMGGPVRSAAIARTKRAGPHAKLTDADVARIRNGGETTVLLGRELGIAQATVSKIRLHKLRRDFSSPFAGLGAR